MEINSVSHFAIKACLRNESEVASGLLGTGASALFVHVLSNLFRIQLIHDVKIVEGFGDDPLFLLSICNQISYAVT